MKVRYLLFVVLGCLALSVYIPAQAQTSTSSSTSTSTTTTTTATCSRFVESAFQQVGTNCANLEAGNLCYGHPVVTASTGPVVNKEFSEAADRLNLLDVTSIHTEPYDPAESSLGIAVMNIQANLPVGFPGKGAVLMAFGDTTVTNAVAAEDALILPNEALDVQVQQAGADLYNVPPGFSVPSQPFGSVPQGTFLQADAISVDGQWLRVFALHDEKFAQSAIAWVKRSALISTLDVSGLPTITDDSYTPMQSFFLTNGLDESSCAELPPSLIYVQGPENTLVDLTVNGAKIRFGSTILLRVLPPGNVLQMLVLTGIGIINPDTPDEIILPPGFASQTCLADIPEGEDENQPVVGEDCNWSNAVLLSFEELESLSTQLSGIIPENLQYYTTSVPRLVCPSGVGDVICTLELDDTEFTDGLGNLCQNGTLPPETCDQLALP